MGTNTPIDPERVVYTNDSEPPGIKVAFCSERAASPMCMLHKTSALFEAPFNTPRSQNDLFPVGSSSTSSEVLGGNRNC